MRYTSICEREWWEKNESIQYTPDMDAAEIHDDWCGGMGEEKWFLWQLKDSHEGEKIREDLKQALGLIVSPDDWETLRKDLIGVLEEIKKEGRSYE